MLICKTPYRISFLGGGSDYPIFYRENRGAVLSLTIDKGCYVQCRYLPSIFKNRYKIVYSEKEDVDNIDDIDHPSVRECLRFMKMDDKRVEIIHTSDIKAESGLGTSSAFTVGLLNGLYALNGKLISKKELAENTIRVEQDLVKENVGSQDQVIATYGGFNKLEFNERGFDVYPITISKAKLNELENSLLLFYTGFSRKASDIAKEQIKNTPNKTSELKRMVEMVDEAIDILNGDSDDNNDFIYEFGKLLDESWQIKRTLSDKITNHEIDKIYNSGINAGATGGKILGAGGGGCVLFVVDPEDDKYNVRQRMKELGLLEIEFKFSNEGSRIIYYDP